MDEKLKELLEQLLRTTQPLAEAASVADTKFLVTLLGIYRISFATLRDIYYLSSNEGCGPSILDLTRKIIEHGVSVEYMLQKDKEKMAARFQEYIWVQLNDEVTFLKSIGQDPASLNQELQLGTEEARTNYEALNSDTKKSRTWAGRSVEDMIKDLHAAGALKEFDSSRIGQAYIWGCRLNHTNPLVAKVYLEPEDHRVADGFYSRLGILVSLSFHLRLTSRLVDESRLSVGKDIYPEIANRVGEIQTALDALE